MNSSIIRHLTVKYKKLDIENEFFRKTNKDEKKNKKFQKKVQTL